MAWNMTDEERKAADPRNKMLKGGVDPQKETLQKTDSGNTLLGSGKAFQAGPNPEAGSIFNTGPKEGVKPSTFSMNNQVTQPNISKIPSGDEGSISLGRSGVSPTIEGSGGKLINPSFVAGLTGTEKNNTVSTPSSTMTPAQSGPQTVSGPPSGSAGVSWRGPQGEARYETVDAQGNITRSPGERENWKAGPAFNEQERTEKPTWVDKGKNEFGQTIWGNPTGGWSGPEGGDTSPRNDAVGMMQEQIDKNNFEMKRIDREIQNWMPGDIYKGGGRKLEALHSQYNTLLQDRGRLTEAIAKIGAEGGLREATAEKERKMGGYYETEGKWREAQAEQARATADWMRRRPAGTAEKPGAAENQYNKLLKSEQTKMAANIGTMQQSFNMTPTDWAKHMAKTYPQQYLFDEKTGNLINRNTGLPLIGGEREQMPQESEEDLINSGMRY